MSSNPYLLAADNKPELLPLLRNKPSLASAQDEHGYSLVHAAASYNHIDLLRTLVNEFSVNVNVRDEDGETPLFVVETVEAARVLVEELHANTGIMGSDGLTAREKIEAEGDFPAVAEYLKEREEVHGQGQGQGGLAANEFNPRQPPPPGMSVRIGTLEEAEDIPSEADPEFRRRIEELAARDDFDTPEGQAELRRLVEDAVFEETLDRNVRPRQS